MKLKLLIFTGILLLIGAFFFFSPNTVVISPTKIAPASALQIIRPDGDISNQPRLANPPQDIRALYITSWVASTPYLFDAILETAINTNINALIIDIKDYSGYISYNCDLAQAKEYQAVTPRIKQLNTLIKRLHDNNLYFIARVAVFQDPRLAKARPDLAVKDANGNIWTDRHDLSWVDTSSEEVWAYHVDLARELTDRGVDEVNFDYIRFPTDGKGLSGLQFPLWDGVSRRQTLQNFFYYLDTNLATTTISADIFGQTVINKDDLGIGQVLEDAYDYFDYISPMIYPSHFINGFIGLDNPAVHPYKVIKYSLDRGLERLLEHAVQVEMDNLATTTPQILSPTQIKQVKAKLRPWLQDFDLGATYTTQMVSDQIQAVTDADLPNSWLIWNPKNNYRPSIFSTATPTVDFIE